jgi:hypothetical protein
MASSSKTRDHLYEELISPLERFSWTEDESVTQQRGRRAKGARLIAGAGALSAIALVAVLYEARLVAFGPLATAASVSPSTR